VLWALRCRMSVFRTYKPQAHLRVSRAVLRGRRRRGRQRPRAGWQLPCRRAPLQAPAVPPQQRGSTRVCSSYNVAPSPPCLTGQVEGSAKCSQANCGASTAGANSAHMGAALGDWGRLLVSGYHPSSGRLHTGRQTVWIFWAARPPRLAAGRLCHPLLCMTIASITSRAATAVVATPRQACCTPAPDGSRTSA
jgi:hypothetical protein